MKAINFVGHHHNGVCAILFHKNGDDIPDCIIQHPSAQSNTMFFN